MSEIPNEMKYAATHEWARLGADATNPQAEHKWQPSLESRDEERLCRRDPERQAVEGAHLQVRQEAMGHRRHV